MSKEGKFIVILGPRVDGEKVANSLKAQSIHQTYQVGGADFLRGEVAEPPISVLMSPCQKMTRAQRSLLLDGCSGVMLLMNGASELANENARFFAELVSDCRDIKIDLREHPLGLQYLTSDLQGFDEVLFTRAFGVAQDRLQSIVSDPSQSGFLGEAFVKMSESFFDS